MNFIVALFQGVDGKTPTADTAPKWAVAVKTNGAYAVGTDAPNQTLAMTPYDEKALPGKCALAPDMTMLKCWTGPSMTPGFDAIKAHAAAHPAGK